MSSHFEEHVIVDLVCCGRKMRGVGTLALREAGAPMTMIAYTCELCLCKASVIDCWPQPSHDMLDVLDTTP